MQLIDPSTRERLIENLVARATKRGSATGRGEVSLLTGVGVLIWALLTVVVLVSTPQALPLDAQRTTLSVGVGGGLAGPEPGTPAAIEADTTSMATSTPTAVPPPTASPTPRPPSTAVAAGPPASPARTATPTATATPSAATPTPPPTTPSSTPSPPTPVVAPAPTVAPLAVATPAATPATVQVAGANGTVLTGPRGGPLNTKGADLYDCRDFTSLEQLIAVFIASGPSDPNHLDPGHTGSPCPPEDETAAE